MRRNRPSRTAQFVTLARALANAGLSHVRGFHDPTARVFLSERGARALAKSSQAWAEGKRTRRVAGSRVMADMLALRTSAIDAAVRDAIAGGIKQLVILGAGYDGRAWRMPELAGVRVFEVDHPATQGEKRVRAAQLQAPIGDVHFVPTDFEQDSLDQVLDRGGHDRALPTCWIWEGVVMYLTHEAMQGTLRDVAARSASGSTLIVNYHTIHRQWFAKIIYWLIGEPQISAWTRDQMAEELKGAGFEVQHDSGMNDWNARFANGEAETHRGAFMRVAVATR